MTLSSPRKTLIALTIGIAALGVTAAAAGDHPRDPAERIAARLERLTEQFHLTPDQQAKVKTILEEQQAAAERLRAETRQRLDGVLTDAQRAERDAKRQQRAQRHLERLTERLGLSPEQVAQVQAIMQERSKDPGLNRSQMRERINAILSPAQRERLESRGLANKDKHDKHEEEACDHEDHEDHAGKDGK